MARYQTASFTTSSVAAGTWLAINHAIYDSLINLVKIKVVPNEAGGTTRFQVYKRDTFLEADKLYDTREFTGALIDPVEDYSDPMTDTPGATAERNEGHVTPYEDADATNEIHLRIYNGDVNAKTYTITITYEHVLVPTGLVGDVNVAGNFTAGNATIQQLWVNSSIDITAATPHLFLTDTTAGAKSLKIAVEGDRAYVTETNAATGTLLNLDLINLRVGLFANAVSLLANTSTVFTGSEGYGPTGNSLVWATTTAGWAMQVVIDSSIAACFGVLISGGVAASANQLLKVENIIYPNTFMVLAQGQVGIATSPGGVFHVAGDQRSSDITFLVGRSITSDTTLAYLASNSPNYGIILQLLYTSTPSINFITSAKGTIIDMLPRNFGPAMPGSVIHIGQNTAGAAGCVNFKIYNGTASYVWTDGAGNLRIGSGGPGTGDTTGVVVGTQTSAPGGKQEVHPVTPDEQTAIVQRIFNAPLFTYEVTSEVDNGFAGLKHLGFMSNQQPMWMRYDESSIDEHRVSMELLAALQELAKFVGFTPAPPGGPPAGMGRFINGQEGIKQWARRDES